MALYKLRHRDIFDWRLAALAAAGVAISVKLGLFILLFPILGGYLTLYLAFCPALPVAPAARYGDLSYGLYIYGWPIEQLVVWLGDAALAWWEVFLISLPLAAACAWLSWRLVEAPALALKPRSVPLPRAASRERMEKSALGRFDDNALAKADIKLPS
jgi:peptidoglycan/LPS O-acetylase OafA/YrhL